MLWCKIKHHHQARTNWNLKWLLITLFTFYKIHTADELTQQIDLNYVFSNFFFHDYNKKPLDGMARLQSEFQNVNAKVNQMQTTDRGTDGHNHDYYTYRRDVEIFLGMPVILTNFENLVSPNNKICSRNINFLSVRMKFCQSNPLVWHFSTSLIPVHGMSVAKHQISQYRWWERSKCISTLPFC